MSQTTTFTYNDKIVRQFMVASIVWGIVGMLVGVIIALQLAFPELNVLPELSFGRLRPLHTNAVIFAFVGNMLFAGIYHSTQRLCKTRVASDGLSKIHFWGWQSIIVAAAITLPLGITQGKEYAELEWPIDLAVAVIWVLFAVNFFWTLAKRREKHLYVAIWFYIATIITVAVLYVVNNLALPVFAGVKSYGVFSGTQDALVQWWYGHNAVAFFLTTPILGIMYYYLPKAANRPVYSYRLSIIHFWALVFLYIWAGPHHLLYTALPDWAQSMGMVFSLMLWAPSWGGMINGLLTLRGAWDKLRTDPVIKFFIAGVTFYGMTTFEGPLLSIKSVSSLGHYTDWIIGHVHNGTLGWNGLMAAGMFYWMVPKLWGTPLHSKKAANTHFWMATIGILLYAVAMWVSGISQGLMWKGIDGEGALLHPDFVETTEAIWPMYVMRAVGGLLYLSGFVLMAWNIAKTIKGRTPVETTVTVTEPEWKLAKPTRSWKAIVFSKPIVLSILGIAGTLWFLAANLITAVVALGVLVLLFLLGYLGFGQKTEGGQNFHRLLEGRATIFSVLVLFAILIGGIAELVPTIVMDKALPLDKTLLVDPYRPLELHGRDIYVREGCYTCHSQMIRPLRDELLRYGEPSIAEESVYDHPFQWGSKRTGPDLARVADRGLSNAWHYDHMMDPRSINAGSVMPAYAFMADWKVNLEHTAIKMSAMKSLGVPYKARHITHGMADAEAQGKEIAADLKTKGIDVDWDSEMVAIIAYLQRLGVQKSPFFADGATEASAAGATQPATGQ